MCYLTKYAIDYLWILKFLFWIHSSYWTYIIFFVRNWHILGRFWITIKNYKLIIKSQKNFKTKTWNFFFQNWPETFLNMYANSWRNIKKSGFFSIWEETKIPREKNKICEIKKIVSNVAKYANSWRNTKKSRFATPKTAKSYETNLKRYFCTDFIEVKVKKILWKKSFKIVANFENLQSGVKHRQIVDKYKKIQVCQIWKFSKFAN